MTRLAWGRAGTRYFEAGVDRGVLYVGTAPGVPWDGLISVEEKPSGGTARARYIDGKKYLNEVTVNEEFEAVVTAYMYPKEFEPCDGSAQVRNGFFLGQQRRKAFGLSYRTIVGNDTDGTSHAYKIHLVYNAIANPATRKNDTLNDSPDPTQFSWDLTTRPPLTPGYRPTAHFVIDSRYINPVTLASIENVLYGTDSTPPTLPTFAQLLTIFDTLVDLEVVDNGDGTAELSAPDEALSEFGPGMYSLTWDTVVDNGDGTFTISS